jgi:CelD/BcsL family acetyltransferase involved in cellulose biosynthesis
LLDLPAEAALVTAAASRGGARVFSRGESPIADLTGGFETYLNRLSSNQRHQARRLIRSGEKENAILTLADADGWPRAFDDLIRLHQERWAAEHQPGVFAAPRFTEFHRALAAAWLPAGRAVLATLSQYGEPVAVLYGFLVRQHFSLYQSGVRHQHDASLRSPGNLAHLLLMQTLADRGVTAYDFLRGSAVYKDRLATRARELVGLEILRNTVRGLAYRSLQRAGRLVSRRPAAAGGAQA